jgi:two-component system CheB/CheR fusion protein
MDATGKVVEFNPAAERVFGFTREEAVGKELAELIIPVPLRERHRQGLQHYVKTGEGPVLGRRIEINALRADGSEILVELAITPFRIQDQPAFAAYLRDITQRKRGEEARQRLAAIVESSGDAIISKDLNGIITSWNKGAERLFGYRPDEIIGKEVTILIPEDRQDEEPGILERIRRGERLEHFETVRRRKDGTLLDISLTISPIHDEKGRVIGASKIGRDITIRVRNDKRRAAQYAVASLLAGASSLDKIGPPIIRTIATSGPWIAGSIWLCENDCATLRCATTWHTGEPQLERFEQATFATALTSAVGLPGRVVSSRKPASISDVTRDDNFPRAAAAQKAGLRGAFAFPLSAQGKIVGVLELFSPQIGRPDDDLIQMVEALGSQIGLFIQRQQIEEELQQQKEAAESANAAKDRFLANLSHELRTPLNPVLIWAGGMARESGLPPEIEEGLQMVCRNVELEARLIDDLLDLTRITRGKLQLHLRKSDAHDLLGHAMDIVRNDITSRELNLSVELNADNHHVLADSSRLQQVFWNLLKNASKFTPTRGSVTVRTFNPKPKALKIEISDTGVGIRPEQLDKVFDAFTQIGRQREGLGLGLAITKAIVEMHHGSIRAFSDGPGKGAKFVIDLETIQDAA